MLQTLHLSKGTAHPFIATREEAPINICNWLPPLTLVSRLRVALAFVRLAPVRLGNDSVALGETVHAEQDCGCLSYTLRPGLEARRGIRIVPTSAVECATK
jgi:hypothetical protein